MAEYFHGTITLNPSTGNWLALPALPAGMAPRRRMLFRSTELVEIGHCTAGQTVTDAGVMCTGGASTFYVFARDFGVVDYTKLTARGISTFTPTLYIYSLSPTDEGPRSM
jgi:hypothetical protein